jgi:hypothetical protein
VKDYWSSINIGWLEIGASVGSQVRRSPPSQCSARLKNFVWRGSCLSLYLSNVINPNEVIPMRLFRLYTGNDGQSHLEEIALAFAPGGMGEVAPMQRATGVAFSRTPTGAFMDWHNAPRRQYVITLAGAVEIGLGDGTVHRFGPGEGILAEDLTGKGHTTRAVGNEARISVTIPLVD